MSDEKRIAIGLDGLTEMVRECARGAEEDGLEEVARALDAVADLPEEERAAGVAVLVRLGKEFAHMFERAAVTRDQNRAGWN